MYNLAVKVVQIRVRDAGEIIHQDGGNTFSTKGFRNWHRKDSFGVHIGPPNSIHNQSKRKCEDLMREEQSIEAAFYKLDDKSKNKYRVRLYASIDVVQFLLNQGLALRSHDESESSLNKDIIKDLDGDYFALLVDESRDVSHKEKMAICLRYADKKGFVMEEFIGLIHVKDTSALSLKKAIVDVLAHHSLTLAYVRGQCYDGARNMQVSKRCVQVGELVLLISNILNVLGDSFKLVDEFRESQKEKLQEALDMGELKMGRGLNQELGLIKAGDTHWGSHYKSFGNFISNFASIVDALDSLVKNARITNDLNVLLQKKEQDISNAMILLQELNDHFNEVTSDFLNAVACLNPIDTFSSFDIKKILVMAKLYPDEFNMRVLENQLVNYTIDVHDIDKRFSNLGELGELSRKLVETKKHLIYPLVFLLVKFSLLLPVANASVERAFSAMKYIKNDLRN
ncbi:uncharacterized protein LOC107865199 [Capsicum annuum]|uniref:uncharacterized protein LOC107865199 n=1 Tax=Capsicum annuum TaxID=4072 RepID=UPI001FB0F533|nr:uncharacterized protein LOC107865199 [Capsicum annuum]